MSAPGTAQPSIHATALVIGDAGVLIRGPSGSGKSTLALMLIAEAERQHRFGRLVGDDRVILSAAGGMLVARPHPRVAGQLERRTQTIAQVPFEPAAVVRLLVDIALTPLPRLGSGEDVATVSGVRLPLLHLQAPLPNTASLLVFAALAAL